MRFSCSDLLFVFQAVLDSVFSGGERATVPDCSGIESGMEM